LLTLFRGDISIDCDLTALSAHWPSEAFRILKKITINKTVKNSTRWEYAKLNHYKPTETKHNMKYLST